MMDPKDKIAAWMRAQYEGVIWVTLSVTVGDSPIENALFVALDAWFTCNSERDWFFRRVRNASSYKDYDPNDPWLFWETQFQISNYRVDFIFCTEVQDCKPAGKMLVVECDGHEFHERTKAQAAADRARDRALQDLGYVVYRFTGSEIYRDPMKCAQQILRWARFVE
jgi:very-short-patch-repair endonuclease